MGDLTRGERNIAWIESHCRVPEGAHVGQPVELRTWQRDIVRGIYDSDPPLRQAIISFPKKNAKTSLSAMLLLLHLCGPEAWPNSQLYSAAQSKEQAATLYNLAAKMVRMSNDLQAFVTPRDHVKELVCRELGTVYRALSSEASTAHGVSPSFIVHDEIGQVRGPRSALYDALEDSTAAQAAPLSIVISTQAATDQDLLSLLIDDALEGNDPRTKLWLWSAPQDADPFAEETLAACNPAFGDFISSEEKLKKAKDAQRLPSYEAAFRNYHLNQRVEKSNPLIPRQLWQDNSGAPDEAVLRERPAYIGLDLSARNDLTALAMVAQDSDGQWHVRCEHFAPHQGLLDRARRDRVPYDQWEKDGWLTTTPGASVDYEHVARRLGEVRDEYDPELVAFDRWRIDVLRKELERLGVNIPLEPFGQGFKDMGPAVDELEAALLNCQVRHGGNPILTFAAASAVASTDPAGNRKPDKAKATGRIDGLAALTMALSVAVQARGSGREESIYEQRGLVVI